MAKKAPAEDEAEVESKDGEGEGAPAAKPGLIGRLLSKKIMLIAGVAVVLLVGGGGGAYMTGFIGGGKTATAEAAPEPPKPAFFYDLPTMTVNLNAPDKRAQYLKLSISLEMGDASTKAAIEPFLPRILDAFQVYLREIRVNDLQGSAGMYRLKEDLQRRINTAVYPAKVTNVLFKEILIQ